MAYKILPWSHDVNKAIHLALHAIAIVLGAFGIYCAFKFHNESGIANLYSLHSWLGIGTIVLYTIQVNNLLLEIFLFSFLNNYQMFNSKVVS
jgi:cytochrome b-561